VTAASLPAAFLFLVAAAFALAAFAFRLFQAFWAISLRFIAIVRRGTCYPLGLTEISNLSSATGCLSANANATTTILSGHA
jgi:hypothetical protein